MSHLAMVALASGCTFREVSAAFGRSPAAWHGYFDCAAQEKKRRYYQANRERQIAKAKARYHANPDQKRIQDRMRIYGLSKEQAQESLSVTNCAICGVELTGHGKNGRVIDHCHQTGRVRGVLCSNCNRGLGHFQDNPAALRAAALYLESNES